MDNEESRDLVGARFTRRLFGGRFECTGGAQASLEGCFIRLWRTPTLIPMYQATYVHDRTSDIFLLSWLFSNQETLWYGAQKSLQQLTAFCLFGTMFSETSGKVVGDADISLTCLTF
jgi:hypothetical protein